MNRRFIKERESKTASVVLNAAKRSIKQDKEMVSGSSKILGSLDERMFPEEIGKIPLKMD